MIRARCHPQLRSILPPPVPAAAALPEWLRSMPSEVDAASLGGVAVRTLKHCPPMIDALATGVIVPLATDLHIADGEIAWDWDPPILEDALISRAPVGLHVPEQASGLPLRLTCNAVVKFMNFWTLEVPEGWSLLFTHPLNREDLPFRSLSGVVDGDLFRDGYVHFPALWTDPSFQGTLPKGTPVAQVIAVPRGGQGLEIGEMSGDDIARNRDVQRALSEDRGVYRKRFRARDRDG
ncbi:hypothetical protein HAT86_04845 [Roseovarius gahaiensis]|uniref:Uncharacterized protein n=1 Tax=Roseovarius gahaiensis TaxID=2716691 RepID=A0A967BC19_9RHOB|nr:hypothetical protein [Roseovarius gahaiensis]NHQ73795.1 hypothetical protein [Roseovarius gahaiensis]